MNRPRLLLAGAYSGVGKTSVTVGLMAAFLKRGLVIQPYKVGPDYIDPTFHNFVTSRKSRNLDSWLLDDTTIKTLFLNSTPPPEKGLSIIEGAMGLFDGHNQDQTGSSAHLAQILSAPVILVIDGATIARTAAAIVYGCDHFIPGFKLAGVIINKVSSPTQYKMLKYFVEQEARVHCFGYLPQDSKFKMESRHLGLIPSIEVPGLSELIEHLGTTVAKTFDLDGLLTLSTSAPDLSAPPLVASTPTQSIRLGLALDEAFNFYYPDALDLLVRFGAKLLPFSPIHDQVLPQKLDGLYLGGGFPEIFAARLAANDSLKKEILMVLEDGLPTYAECGGLMYLSQTLIDYAGLSHSMLNFFPTTTNMTKHLQNFGYVTVTFDRDTVLGPSGTKIRAHEFHHSYLEGTSASNYVLTMTKSDTQIWRGGLCRKNVLAAYPHLHFCTNPKLAAYFIAQCQQYNLIKTGGTHVSSHQ